MPKTVRWLCCFGTIRNNTALKRISDIVEFPKSVQTFHELKDEILQMIGEANEDFQQLAYQSWETLGIPFPKKSFLEDYKSVINLIGRVNFYNELKEANLSEFSSLLD